MWTLIEVEVGKTIARGRFRLQGDTVVLEWRGGRHEERCGLVKPEVVATCGLKRLAAERQVAA